MEARDWAVLEVGSRVRARISVVGEREWRAWIVERPCLPVEVVIRIRGIVGEVGRLLLFEIVRGMGLERDRWVVDICSVL